VKDLATVYDPKKTSVRPRVCEQQGISMPFTVDSDWVKMFPCLFFWQGQIISPMAENDQIIKEFIRRLKE
jgi:hypothetical protein